MSRLASISIDLDNQWSYMKTHGDDAWAEFPTYLDTVVPHIESFADRHDVTLTVFVVGQDAELDSNRDALAVLGKSRHEIANHSFHHEPWLHLKSDEEVAIELKRAHFAIGEATGQEPKGFRGPGFSVSESTLRALVDLEYTYDASTLPTFIGPLARAFYLRASDLNTAELDQREKLFGTVRDVFRSIRPYRWDNGLVEIPVTTMPFMRVPIHGTYLLYLARWSETLSYAYLKTAVGLCRMAGVEPSMLLHSLDFIGGDDVTNLAFFPGMDMEGAKKRQLLDGYLRILGRDHELVDMARHVSAVSAYGLPVKSSSTLA